MILLILRIQYWLQPYKERENNRIEELAIISGLLTMYWAILIIEDPGIPGFMTMMKTIMIGINIYFIIQWVYLFWISLNFKSRCYQIFIAIFAKIICKQRANKPKTFLNHSINSLPQSPKFKKILKKSPKKKVKKHKRKKHSKSKSKTPRYKIKFL